MTETTAAPVASEAPAPAAPEAPPAEAPPAEAPPVEAPTPAAAPEVDKSATPDQRKQSAKERIMAKYEQMTQPRVPKGTPEGGEFAKKEAEAAGAAPAKEPESPPAEASAPEVLAPEGVPASGAPEVEATPAEPANAPADGYVRVPVGADHPLRQRGREFFDVPKDQEMDLRGALNSHTRRSQVQATEQQLATTSAQLAESRADTEYWRGQATSGGALTPEQQGQFTDILNTYGEEAANNFRNGLLANADTADLEARRAEARQQHQIGEVQKQAERFATSALNDALQGNPDTGVPAQYPHWSELEVRQCLSGYGSICDARGTPPTPSGWYAYANGIYASHPGVMAANAEEQRTRAAKVAEDAKAKAIEEAGAKEAAAMKEAATRHATLPGHIPSEVASGGVDHGTPDEEAALRKLTPTQQKRARSARIRDWGARAQ